MKSKKTKTIAEIIEDNPDAEKMLFDEGMFCAGCPYAKFESIEQGARAHGLDAKKILKKIKSKKKVKKAKK